VGNPTFLSYLFGGSYALVSNGFTYMLRPFQDVVLSPGPTLAGAYGTWETVADLTCASGQRYSHQLYSNGAYCAVILANRTAVVTYICASDFISQAVSAAETTTCVYTMTLAVDCRNNGDTLCVPDASSTATPTLSVGAAPSTTPSVSATATPSRTPSVTPLCGVPVTDMKSLSGLAGTVGTQVALASNTLGWGGSCGNTLYATQPKLIYRIDLSAYPVGGSLNVNNCAGTADTIIVVGTGCPTSLVSFGCVGGADAGCPVGGNNPSSYTVAATTVPVYFAIIQMWTSTVTAVTSGFNFTYTLPTVTPTSSQTPSNTATATLSFGATPSPTASPTSTLTSTPSPTNSPSGTPSWGFTASPSPLAGCTVNGATQTAGLNTSTLVVLDPSASSIVGASTACAGGGYAINTLPKQVIAIDLGPSFVAGGVLRATTCNLASFDTVLFVGKGCPSSAAAFQCAFGNDDGCSLQSNIIISGWDSRYVFVLATGFSATSVGSMFVNVDYVLPTTSPTASRTPSSTATGSLSQGATPSPTTSVTGSSSATATPTPSFEYTLDPSDTPSVTASTSATGSVSATLPPGSTPSVTTTATRSQTVTPTPSATATGTPQCGSLVSIAQTLTGASNVSRAVVITTTSPLLFAGATTCGSGPNYILGPKAIIAIDLAGYTLGQPLTVTTCGLGLTTPMIMWAGIGCPTSSSGFQCLAGAGTASSATAPCPTLTLPEVPASIVYVVLGHSQGLVGNVAINYTYQLPPATPSNTPSRSQTPPNTPPNTSTPSNTPSPSGTATPTATLSAGALPSATATGTAPATSTPSGTPPATPTPSCGFTPAETPSTSPSPSNTGLPGCSSRVTVTQSFYGLSGTMDAPFTFSVSGVGLPTYVFGACASGDPINTNGKVLYEINLPDSFALGGVLDINACNVTGSATLDGMMWVGTGCPTDLGSFRCLVGNDQSSSSAYGACAAPASANQARVVISPVVKRTYYVLAAPWSSASGAGNFGYSYIPPTPTATTTASNTGSASITPSAGSTPSETGSISMTASNTKTSTPSIGFTASHTPSGTVTASRTATSSLTSSATPPNTATASISFGASPSRSGSITPSQTPTASVTASMQCPAALTAPTADNGYVSYAVPATNNAPLSGTCAGYPMDGKRHAVVKITIASAPGGTLVVGTCTGTSFDSTLWLGYGCGTDAAAYQCQIGNDDATGCGAGSQSQVTLSGTTSQTVYALVGVYNGGAGTSFGLTWNYTAPSATPTATRTRSVSATATSTPSNTPSGTPPPSITATASGSAASTATCSASAAAMQSSSNAGTQSPASTGSISNTSTGTPPPSSSPSRTATSTETASNTAASTATRSASAAATRSRSSTGTPTPTSTGSSSSSPSSSVTGSSAATATASTSASASETSTPAETTSPSPTVSPSGTAAPSLSRTPAASQTATKTRLPSPSRTKTKTATKTRSRTPAKSKSKTRTRTRKSSRTRTPSFTPHPTDYNYNTGCGHGGPCYKSPTRTRKPKLA
jgi:hypothetical protein